MVLFAVGQFVAEDEGHFVFIVVQLLERADVDAHVVAQRAEGVEGPLVVDEVFIRLRADGGFGFLRRDGRAQAAHKAVQHGVGRRIPVDAVFILDLVHVLVPAFIVQVMHLAAQVGILGPYFEDGDGGGPPVRGISRPRNDRRARRHSQCRRQYRHLGQHASFPHSSHHFPIPFLLMRCTAPQRRPWRWYGAGGLFCYLLYHGNREELSPNYGKTGKSAWKYIRNFHFLIRFIDTKGFQHMVK